VLHVVAQPQQHEQNATINAQHQQRFAAAYAAAAAAAAIADPTQYFPFKMCICRTPLSMHSTSSALERLQHSSSSSSSHTYR
jgi:hypothetical protein